uniref:phage tail tube protein n=1 Tax=Paracoccus marcusii TaxID=59779 RepID=UPI003736D30E
MHTRLSALPATAQRGEVLPERVLAAGLLILRDGEPEVTLSPLTYHYQHRAEIKAVVQGAIRDAAFDTLCASIGTALAADRPLGGLCDWVEAEAPQPVNLPVDGAASLAIETAMPEVPRYAIYSGVVLDQLSWQMQRSGLLTATARLVAQGETVATTSGAGTPSELDLIRFGHFNGAIKRNGTALGNVISTEITYANNLDRIETVRADGMIDGADPSIAALTGRTEVRFADTTLVTQEINGTPCELEFSWTLVSGESLTVTVHTVYLPRPGIEIGGPQGIQASFDWQAARDATLGRMCIPATRRRRRTRSSPPGWARPAPPPIAARPMWFSRNCRSRPTATACRSCPSRSSGRSPIPTPPRD